MRRVVVFLALVLAVTAARAEQTPVVVKHLWARPGIRGGNSAVYMEIHNTQAHRDRLVAAGTDVAEVAELHRTHREGDMHRMERVPYIEVPAGGRVELRPGGLHIMLLRLNTPLRAGDRFPMILRFERAGRLAVEVQVREQADAGGEHR